MPRLRFRVRTLMGLVAIVALVLWGVPTSWRFVSYASKARRLSKVAAVAAWYAPIFEQQADRNEGRPIESWFREQAADARSLSADAREHAAIYREAMFRPWAPLEREPIVYPIGEHYEREYDRRARP